MLGKLLADTVEVFIHCYASMRTPPDRLVYFRHNIIIITHNTYDDKRQK